MFAPLIKDYTGWFLTPIPRPLSARSDEGSSVIIAKLAAAVPQAADVMMSWTQSFQLLSWWWSRTPSAPVQWR